MSYIKYMHTVPEIGHYILVENLEVCPFPARLVRASMKNGPGSKERHDIEVDFSTKHNLKQFKRVGDYHIEIPKRTVVTVRDIDDRGITMDINKSYNKDNVFGSSNYPPRLRLYHGISFLLDALYLKRSDGNLINSEKKKTKYIVENLGRDIV